MINALLYKLTGHLKCRLIHRVPGERYLERYYVGALFGVTFYLHRFVADDEELHVHNHPWGTAVSLVLSGGYREELAVDICPHATPVDGSGCLTRERDVRWLNVIHGATFHRILSARPGTWTLFAHNSRVRVRGALKGWGFLRRTLPFHTEYVPVVAQGNPEWWHAAKTGAKAGRAPL